MYKKTDIKVGYACNNHCTFCVQGDKRHKYPPKKLQEIKDILDKEYKLGSKCVVFTGGEPTVNPNLVEAVAYAKKIGFDDIQVQSNGTNFDDIEFVEKLIDAGVTIFNPSIHGFHRETHDKQVNTKGAWDRVVRGLINLRKLNQTVITNTVITQDNFKEIPKLAGLLIKLRVSQFQFAFVHILGSADKNKDSVVPRKKDIIPYIHKALDMSKKYRIPALTEAIPFCLMQGYEWAISETIMPDASIYDAEYITDSYTDYRLNGGKAKRKECLECSKFNVCEGPWREYPEMYSWDEFIPVK